MKSTISIQSANSLIGEANFRVFPNICMEGQGENFVAVTASKLIDEPTDEQWGSAEEEVDTGKKPKKGEEPVETEPKVEIKFSDFDLVLNNPPPKPEIEIEEEKAPEGEGEKEEEKKEGEGEGENEGEAQESEKAETEPLVEPYIPEPRCLDHAEMKQDLDEDAYLLVSRSNFFVF